MPKSKRDKKVSLTKTSKHGMDWKKKMIAEVREEAEKYECIYVFKAPGMRLSGLNEFRKKFRDSRIFLGKNKVLALALGKDEESEILSNIHQLSSRLKGQSGLFMTNRDKQEILDFVESFTHCDYAKSGMQASETVKLDEGPLEQFPHSLEPRLRSLGLPTLLKKGVITLMKNYTVCKEGEILTPEQCKILKLLEIPMANLKFTLHAVWKKPDQIEILMEDEEPEIGSDAEEMEINDDDD